MKLSTVFEMLLIFLLIAFAAHGRVIDRDEVTLHRIVRATNTVKQNHMGVATISLKQATDNVNRYCTCNDNICNCCRDFNIPLVQLKGPGCASVQYLKGDNMALQLSFGDNILTSTVVSGKSPKPVCVPLPGGFSKFCGRIYSIQRETAGDHFKACLGLELQSSRSVEASLRVSCFRFGPEGLKLRPSEPLPVVEADSSADEDDDDDDIFGLGSDDDDEDDDDDDDDDDEDDTPSGNSVPSASSDSDDDDDDDDDDDVLGLGLGSLFDIFGDDDTPKKPKPTTPSPFPAISIPLLTKPPTQAVPIVADVAETSVTPAGNDLPVGTVSKPAADVTQAAEEVAKPAEEVAKPAEEVAKPAEEVAKPAEEAAKPAEEAAKPAEEVAKPAEEATKPAEEALNADEGVTNAEEETASVADDVTEGGATSVVEEATDAQGTTPAAADELVPLGSVIENNIVVPAASSVEEEYVAKPEEATLIVTKVKQTLKKPSIGSGSANAIPSGTKKPSGLSKPAPKPDPVKNETKPSEEEDDEEEEEDDEDSDEDILGGDGLGDDDDDDDDDDEDDEKEEAATGTEALDDDKKKPEDEKIATTESDESLLDDDDDDDDDIVEALAGNDKENTKLDKISANEAEDPEADDADYGFGLAEILARKHQQRHIRGGRQSRVMRL